MRIRAGDGKRRDAMQRKVRIAPSILSADFGKLADEIKRVERAGADLLHCDIMDGHFVPNITIGPLIINSIRKITKLPIEAHLMIERPQDYIEAFAKAGSDIITFHIETTDKPKNIIKLINSFDKMAGVAINPHTEMSSIDNILDEVDFVLIMSVEPGFGGQKFMDSCLPKIRKLRDNFERDIAVDGGINPQTAAQVIEAGANILAAGTYIFKSTDAKKAIDSLRSE